MTDCITSKAIKVAFSYPIRTHDRITTVESDILQYFVSIENILNFINLVRQRIKNHRDSDFKEYLSRKHK
jgi:hypothetical protein